MIADVVTDLTATLATDVAAIAPYAAAVFGLFVAWRLLKRFTK